jgi:uncharacterized SAM-binding protein YcdF (DUF218 family)
MLTRSRIRTSDMADRPIARIRVTPPRPSAVLRVAALAAVAAVIFAGIAIAMLGLAIFGEARNDETAPADAIVVLGTAQWDGRPSTTFQARLDHALELYRTGYAPIVVLTGGFATGDRYSEAGVGRAYLRDRGVPDNALETVPEGRTSAESLSAARDLLVSRSSRTVLLVSDPFHMFRLKRMSSDLGLDPLASPTWTSPIRPDSPLEYRYMARELVAYIAYAFVKS